MQKIFFIALIGLSFNIIFGQTIPQVNIPLNVSDGFRTRVLYFGLDPTATNGIDQHLDEMEQPPLPPSGIFDARFIGQDINIPELGEGVLKDYRNGTDTTKGQRIHEIRYQVGSGTTITISWNFPSGVTGQLQDFFGGVIVNKTMIGKDSIVVTNPGALNKLKMTINYNLNGQLLPSSPNLIYPSNGSTNIVTDPTLRWTTVSGSIRYHLQIALDSNFVQKVFDDTTIQTNTKEVQLSGNKKYFWRVRARNRAGWSPFSSVWFFTTILNPPAQPKLNSPPKGAIGVSIPVNLKWYSVVDADNYSVTVDDDSTFSNPEVNQTVIDTTLSIQNLSFNKKYYWRVVANNSAGSSSPSEIWNFTTLATNVENQEVHPKHFVLHQNYPNPFNSSTIISYELPNDSHTKFFLFDLVGREILKIDFGLQKAGFHQFELDLMKLEKFNSTSGIIIYKLVANDKSLIKKMIYLK
ncbi:MAG: fibronectin type III domain-containing protein [Ignavibacteria bacterium]|nr:fibronectin type III domain-containing protein [Ignavibacteria bacterium]